MISVPISDRRRCFRHKSCRDEEESNFTVFVDDETGADADQRKRSEEEPVQTGFRSKACFVRAASDQSELLLISVSSPLKQP
jgi:hypothetical protein